MKKKHKKYNKPRKTYEELANISHLNSIRDELDHGNRGIVFGRAIMSRKTAGIEVQ